MENYSRNPTSNPSAFGRSYASDQEGHVDDEVVWERFKKGNKAALTHIYRNYSNPLFNYGCQIAADREMVKDAIQDLFIEIINNKERLGKTTSIKYYLFKALRNKLVKLLVKKNKETGKEMESECFQVSISPEIMLINRQIDQEKQQILSQKLNELPVLQREILLLFYYEGMKYDQIAGILGIKTKSARALLYRAIESLGKLLKPLKGKVI